MRRTAVHELKGQREPMRAVTVLLGLRGARPLEPRTRTSNRNGRW